MMVVITGNEDSDDYAYGYDNLMMILRMMGPDRGPSHWDIGDDKREA